MIKILVSACLLGEKVRYDGQSKNFSNATLNEWQDKGWLVPFCPEVCAGMLTPRLPAEIEPNYNGEDVLEGIARIYDLNNDDVTESFMGGALMALNTALTHNCAYAILTEKSPSCGSSLIYDGTHSGQIKKGMGVATALLQRNGIKVFGQDEIDTLKTIIEDKIKARF